MGTANIVLAGLDHFSVVGASVVANANFVLGGRGFTAMQEYLKGSGDSRRKKALALTAAVYAIPVPLMFVARLVQATHNRDGLGAAFWKTCFDVPAVMGGGHAAGAIAWMAACLAFDFKGTLERIDVATTSNGSALDAAFDKPAGLARYFAPVMASVTGYLAASGISAALMQALG